MKLCCFFHLLEAFLIRNTSPPPSFCTSSIANRKNVILNGFLLFVVAQFFKVCGKFRESSSILSNGGENVAEQKKRRQAAQSFEVFFGWCCRFGEKWEKTFWRKLQRNFLPLGPCLMCIYLVQWNVLSNITSVMGICSFDCCRHTNRFDFLGRMVH